MVMRRASEVTDQIARSLLQKAIRRGCKDVATATFWHLAKERKSSNGFALGSQYSHLKRHGPTGCTLVLTDLRP